MKRFFISLLIGWMSAFPVLASDFYSVIYVKDGLSDMDQADKRTALQLWVDDMSRQEGLSLKIEAADNIGELFSKIQSQAVAGAILNTDILLRNYAQLSPLFNDKLFAIKRYHQRYENFIVVVRDDSHLERLSQLANSSLSTVDGYLILNRYLNHLTRQQSKATANNYLARIIYEKNANRALLNVYFKRAQAAIIPSYTFEMAAELNPALLKELKIIHQSGPVFIPAVVLTLKSAPADVIDKFNHNLQSQQLSNRGQEMLSLFQLEGFDEIDMSALKPMQFLYP